MVCFLLRLPSIKVIFHQVMSSFKSHLPYKSAFHRGSSSIKLSFFDGHLPSIVDFYNIDLIQSVSRRCMPTRNCRDFPSFVSILVLLGGWVNLSTKMPFAKIQCWLLHRSFSIFQSVISVQYFFFQKGSSPFLEAHAFQGLLLSVTESE